MIFCHFALLLGISQVDFCNRFQNYIPSIMETVLTLFCYQIVIISPFIHPRTPLTSGRFYATFYMLKAVTKTRRFRRIPREDATLVHGSRNTAQTDTTFVPPGRNARTGAPVKAPMSDSASCNQGGTVEYFVSHP